MPNPDGVRRKGYSKVRLLSWALAIDKFGFVRCQTSNCKFMAFDYDEMQQHYSNCFEATDESKLFMCSICNLGTTNANLLNNHMIRYHPKEAEKNGMDEYRIICSKVYKKVSKITKDGWTMMLEQKGYIKCLTPYCNFLTDLVSDMESHYGHCYEWYKVNQSCFSCVDCEGKTATVEKMLQHIADCHPPGTTKDSPINNIPLALVSQWTESINKGENIFCKTFNCKFISDNVEELKRHYRFCRTPRKDSYSTCPFCSNWCHPSKLCDHLKQHTCSNEEASRNFQSEILNNSTNENSLKIELTVEPDVLDEKKIDPVQPTVHVLDDEEFPLNFTRKVLKQYQPSTKKAKLKVQVPQVPQIVHSLTNIDLEERNERVAAKMNHNNKIDLDFESALNSPSYEISEFDGAVLNETSCPPKPKKTRLSNKMPTICPPSSRPIRTRIPRKRKSLGKNLENSKPKCKKIEKNDKSILDSLGDKIMEEQSVSYDSLVPIEITVDDVQWTLNVPPIDVAQKVVERERLTLQKMMEASLKESRRIFNWTKIDRNVNKTAFSNQTQEYNPLKRKILDLKKLNKTQEVSRPQIEPSVINLDNPSDISNILKKYATVVSNEEDKIFNNLVSDVETALEEDQFDISFLTNTDVDF